MLKMAVDNVRDKEKKDERKKERKKEILSRNRRKRSKQNQAWIACSLSAGLVIERL